MKIGFLGAGAMGGAIITGALKSQIVSPDEVYISDFSRAITDKYKEMGCNIVSSNKELGESVDILQVAVKPQYAESALKDLGDSMDGKAMISIMAGLTTDSIREMTGGNFRLLRLMPNTPALVGEGMTAAVIGELVTEDEKNKALEILGSFGQVEVVSEHIMDAVVAVSGSSPAYVFMLIEAMADGAVADGMPRAQAYKFASQAVLGSARMALELGRHPGELKDMVCSPAGTTIEAVRVLEKKGFRSAIIEAEKACADVNRRL